ncbi:MAG: hypothetical protein MPN21_23190 [Thermoanaerobaculia bacterium]|nr:hypothetical protein [Thermoanaerobaculia bacterium]
MKQNVVGVAIAVVLAIVFAAASFGGGCVDETNPECWECKSFFIGSWSTYCGIVTFDGTVGHCECEQVPVPGGYWACAVEGEFCGMIIVVG